uniref:Uncharacterized protein n=1 Tax=Panagrolaimus sp. PS1159 TaxID=55785 RepID=A0AC35G9T6_9BILA
MTFPHAELIPRDPKTFMVKNKTIQGVKGVSVLREYLESFPQGAVIDAMHSVYKGPMEDDLKRLFNGFKFNDTGTRLIKLDKLGKELLEKVLANTTFPKEYQRRRIRPVDMFANWKASELKLFTIYVIPSVFIYLSSSQPPNLKPLLDSMIKYVAAIRLLINSKITPNMISFASDLLKDWSSQRAHLWGDKTMTFKTHQALHLVEQVVQHGPLSTHSAFYGESAIGRLGKNISCFSIEVSVKQICERMVMEHASLGWIEEHSQADLKKMFKLTTDNLKRKTQQPSEDVEKFLKLQNIAYVVLGEIVISGFSICPFWKSGSADCYVAMSTTNGYKPLKVMAIIENSTKEILFCCKLLNTKPYSTLMTPEGILASQPLAYEYCCYGVAENFEKNEYIIYYDFLITVPHAYEHN